ncbi:TetR/AcrR family transcriptional regulator [Actinopolyspora halophila]|uniref:TetR/AcrR family transcriptional regulator n=1 Tax=Actinopolyspora halophila TaxID=1850 RepID=UPI0003717C18|nr:TetR/AcrR family transcriptional regulator [Actinopolyspora halophila]
MSAEDVQDGNSRKRAPARERLLDTASELFYRHGIRAVGIDTVIEHAGVAKMSLYNHFRSKDELVVAYLERRERRWCEFLDARAPDAAAEPVERLRGMLDVLGSWLAEECPRGCAFTNAEVELADPEHPAHEVIRADKEHLRERIGAVLGDAGVSGVEHLADQVFMLFESVLVTFGMGTVEDPVRAAKDVVSRLLG